MMDFVRKHREVIFIITIIGFLAATFFGFGSYFFIGKTPADNVLEVNGEGVPYKRFTSLMNQVRSNMLQNKEEINEQALEKKKQEVMQQLIQEQLFWQEAKKYGITISDTELANDLRNYPAFLQEGKFNHLLYYRILAEVLHETPKQFEDSRRKQIAGFRLRMLISSAARISEPELQMEYAKTNKGNMTNYDRDRDKFLAELKKQQSVMVLNDWLRYLNQNMKVQIHLDEIERKFQK